MWGRRLKIALVVVGVVLAVDTLFHEPIRRWVIGVLSKPYQAPPADTSGDTLAASEPPTASGAPQPSGIVLAKVAEGFTQPTDIQFPPGERSRMIVLEKTGVARWVDLADGRRGELLSVAVRTESEEGLLGLAFHPRFASNGHFFVHYTPAETPTHRSRIARFTHPSPADLGAGRAVEDRVVLEVEQPYQNHNAGQLAFGPDGMLYVAMGDGGLADDPHDNGQNLGTLLGKMLRIDVDRADRGRAYAIPPDNPFLKVDGARPELWAIGLRNPWRFTFAPDGRMIVGDVGQNQWEEIDIVETGDNLGWSVREGLSCFDDHPDCGTAFVDPIHVYGREVGQSLTGGHVYGGSAIPWLRGHYVFADFASGRFFALKLPAVRQVPPGGLPAIPLGRWPVLPSAFGVDTDGEVYVAAFGHGIVYRLASDAPREGGGDDAGTGDDAGMQ